MTDTTQSDLARFADYLPAIRRRWQAEQTGWRQRRAAALGTARRAADILHTQFSAKRVIAFGSLVRDGRFDERSDIDLAVEGIARADYLRAWSAVDTHPAIEIDLIDLADCPPSWRDRILDEGMSL